MTLSLVPVTKAEACEFVANFHRHNKPPLGHIFSLAASDGSRMVGVAICGRPVARLLQDGETLEVLRCCVVDDAPKGTPSFLYARAWRAARALGWARLITYTLQAESGASMRGGGMEACRHHTRPRRRWMDESAGPRMARGHRAI